MARRRALIGRALLSLALWAGFWLLGLGVVGGLLAIPIAQGAFAGGPDGAGLLAGAGALVVAWSLRPRLGGGAWKRPAPLSRAEFPALHALVDRVAAQAGARPPDEVQLSSRANASIGVERRWLGLRRTRVLELGLGLFAFLDADELASVVAHELGHERGGELLLGAWVHRTRRAIAGAVDGLEDSAFLLDLPFRAYGGLFLRVSSQVSREQELSADAHAAAVCGTPPTWRALRKIDALGAFWEAYFECDLVPIVDRGARIPVLEGFRRFLAAPRRRASIERHLAALAERPPAPGDTHPPSAQRLRALDPARLVGAIEPGPGSAALLGGEAEAEAAWYPRATRGELTPMGWDEVGTRAVVPGIAGDLEGTPLDATRTDLAALPRLVGEADAVWQGAARGVNLLSPAARRRQGLRLLGDWLAVALARRGFELRVRPGMEPVLLRGAEEVEPATVVAALADGAVSEAAYLVLATRWDRAEEATGVG